MLRDSSTYHPRGSRHRSSIGASGPGSRWWAFGTSGEGRPLGSCVAGILRDTCGDALEAASTTSLVWSRWASKALAAHVGGTLAPGYYSGVGRSDHAGGCPASGLDCSKRTVIVPLPGGGRMRNPWRISLRLWAARNIWSTLVTSSDMETGFDSRQFLKTNFTTYVLDVQSRSFDSRWLIKIRLKR